MRTARCLTAAVFLAVAQPWLADPAGAADPVLERVLLSTGGVGYFGYRATTEADGRLRLTVPLRQVDDILKSLTILSDSGTVRAVSLLGPTPLGDLFRDVPFGQADLVDLPSLLLRLRGAEVEVRGATTLRGRILTVAREETTENQRTTVTHRLSVMGADGIRSVVLEPIDGLTFTEPSLARQVELVLARLGEDRGEQQRELEIALGSAPGSTVGLGYLAEMPLWKASWRLVAREGDGLLQGWAILENASGQDWHDVDMTLIAGSPRALRQALFESHFVTRPEVPVGEPARKERGLGASQVAMAPPAAESMPAMDLAARAPAPLAVGAPQELTAQTLFHLPQPVTLATGHTVMAPIVDRTLPIERVARYVASEGGAHPNAALRLRNTTGASLPAGLATLYEELPGGGLTYLGDAPLPQLAPDADELLDYGLDGNIDVAVQTGEQGRLDRGRIADGVLELARVEQQRFAYAVTSRFAGAPRSFVLEQELPDGWRVAEPPEAMVEGAKLRVTRSLPPAAGLELAVVLERPVVQRIELLNADPEQLLLEFNGLTPPPPLRDALARLQMLSGQVADVERAIEQVGTRQAELTGEQARLRENLAAVPRESDLAKRYLERLGASEDELAELAKRLTKLRADQERAAQERRAFIRALKV
jgi:hypothetical protein